MAFNKDTIDDILTLFIAILYFQSIPRFQFVGGYLEKYPLIVFGIATILLLKRKDIINMLSK